MTRAPMNHRIRHRSSSNICGADPRLGHCLQAPAAALVLVAVTAWSYGPIIAGLSRTLRNNADYSVGQLVPPVAIFFVWNDRKRLKETPVMPCWLGGIALLLLAEVAHIYGYLSMRQSIERYAILVAVAGLVLLVAGRDMFRRLFWALAFLFLMVPLPTCVHTRVSPPLQEMAIDSAVFLLEASGAWVTQEGNILVLDDHTKLGIEEACGGLRMLIAFVIVAAFIAYMIKRPRWYKTVVLASSIPVAVACNILRIFLTAVIMLHVSVELGDKFFHDFAGLVMMPAAVSLILAEIRFLDRILEPAQIGKHRKEATVIARSVRRVAAG